jgi:hypothetical protein
LALSARGCRPEKVSEIKEARSDQSYVVTSGLNGHSYRMTLIVCHKSASGEGSFRSSVLKLLHFISRPAAIRRQKNFTCIHQFLVLANFGIR